MPEHDLSSQHFANEVIYAINIFFIHVHRAWLILHIVWLCRIKMTPQVVAGLTKHTCSGNGFLSCRQCHSFHVQRQVCCKIWLWNRTNTYQVDLGPHFSMLLYPSMWGFGSANVIKNQYKYLTLVAVLYTTHNTIQNHCKKLAFDLWLNPPSDHSMCLRLLYIK